MTPGVWIARPGSQVRHLLGLHHSGNWCQRVDGDVTWLGVCRQGRITTPDDPECSPYVAEEDMHLYRPCKRCVMILKWRVDWYREILDVAWNDIRRSQPKELVG